MIKLKQIVTHLDNNTYKRLEDTLVKNKSDNFLFLLHSYRSSEIKDPEIAKILNISTNSLYVLKSRLNDKIQEHLSGNIYSNKEEVLKQLHQIPTICYGSLREVAYAFLQKLEKDLLYFDLHNELLVVYSALKKMHLYSDKYFYYSQLYNKHTAYGISLEKCEEILGNFNRTLAQYNFSRAPKLMETLVFMSKEINDHFSLNPSRQIEIIKNIIELQLTIFFNQALPHELNIQDTLVSTEKILNDLPDSSLHKNWINVLDYLSFEYYLKMGQIQQASVYYEKTNKLSNTLLLYSNLCLTPKFLISKLTFLQTLDRMEEIMTEDSKAILFDSGDTHSVVLLGIYEAMLAYHKKKYKEATSKLNEILNSNSFKDYFHINIEIKLTLAFIYITIKEYDLADSLLKNIYRKIKSEKTETYSNVLDLIRIFNSDIKQNGKVTTRQKDDFILFQARNINEHKLLAHLELDLKKNTAKVKTNPFFK